VATRGTFTRPPPPSPCARSYATLQSAGALWPCPNGSPSNSSCGAGEGACEPGTGDNPLCMNLDAGTPCCCPKAGCWVEPRFNWIVGVCKGAGCACGGASAPSCAPQNRTDRCAADCTGPVVPCCFGADVTDLQPYYDEGTHAKVNYIAAYQFDAAAGQWVMQPESSFNTNGSLPTFDMMKPFGGLPPTQAWLAPQPGGSVFWSLGYYPAGVRGVGPPGAMFVLSTEDWFAGTWYMLNQLTLDRGPGAPYPSAGCAVTNDNCWASGNAGEMDFLEPGWNNPATAAMNYTQTFSTQNNQVGRCFNGGVNSGGFDTDNYLLTEASPLAGAPPEPIIYVAVVDSVGNWVYRIPAAAAPTLWPGLTRYTASTTLPAAPTRRPDSVNPGNTTFGATFTSNCQASNYTAALAQECIFNGQQGFCGNWWRGMANTGQPLFPSANCTRDVRGGATMPWCACMVGRGQC
jgi:hypothetical protein